MEQLILSVEQRGNHFHCILFERYGTVVQETQRFVPDRQTDRSWIEQDAGDIARVVTDGLQAVLRLAGKGWRDINALALAVERGSMVLWDRRSGEPVLGAVPWYCTGNATLCDELRGRGLEKQVRDKCGLFIAPRFSGTKIRRALEEIPDGLERARAGELLFGSMESWLIWQLTGGAVHACDCTNAAYTMLYNIHAQRWDEELLALAGVPAEMLPEAGLSSRVFGETAPDILGGPVPIACAAGSQNASLFGQTCYDLGRARAHYGNGCNVMLHTGLEHVQSKSGLLETFAYGTAARYKYALEAGALAPRGTVGFLRDELRLFRTWAEADALCAQVPEDHGLTLVPPESAPGTPHRLAGGQGLLAGWNGQTEAGHLVRAALEAMAFQVYDALTQGQADTGCRVETLHADGDACESDFLLQFQADLLQIPVCRPAVRQVAALGAAYMAGVVTGFYTGRPDIVPFWKAERIFEPAMPEARRDSLLQGWHKTLEAAKALARKA